MRPVQIAELKNHLSAYLHKVRAGEEVIICDRKAPIAKIVPLSTGDFDLDEQALMEEGLLLPPRKPFDAEAFFAIGRGLPRRPVSEAAIRRAMDASREDVDVSLLGHKRARRPVRSRPSQRTR